MEHITRRSDIRTATRKQLIEWLESWGFQCYSTETTAQLRRAAYDNWDTEYASN